MTPRLNLLLCLFKGFVMQVRYVHPTPNCHGNILWQGKYPMRGGVFPHSHPLGIDSKDYKVVQNNGQFHSAPPLEAFRQRGYWASCFPEGDGITMTCLKRQGIEQVKTDIAECFGWEVVERLPSDAAPICLDEYFA